MLSESAILTALRDCFDPELKLNVVDLGLIYDPASGLIVEQVRNRLAGIPDISRIDVSLVWEPAWSADRISEEGRRLLGPALLRLQQKGSAAPHSPFVIWPGNL